MKKVKTKPEDYQVKLLDAAEEAMEKAYNPYSHFYVGAALLTADGKIITGANYENASYGNTICAERAALLKANAEGYRRFKAIAIIAKGENFDVDKPTAPCGACRQSIFEAFLILDFIIFSSLWSSFHPFLLASWLFLKKVSQAPLRFARCCLYQPFHL